MKALLILASAIIGFLLGSISFARIGIKLAGVETGIKELKIPVEDDDEGSPVGIFGANAASMVLGAKGGIAIATMDILKIAVPMVIVKLFLLPASYYHLVISISGLIGHNWPIYFGFKGERGFSIILGSLIVVDWLGAILLPIMGILFDMFIVSNMLVSYVSWLLLLIPWLWIRTHDYVYFIYSLLVVFLFVLSTRPEIRTIIEYRKKGKLNAYQQSLPAFASMARDA